MTLADQLLEAEQLPYEGTLLSLLRQAVNTAKEGRYDDLAKELQSAVWYNAEIRKRKTAGLADPLKYGQWAASEVNKWRAEAGAEVKPESFHPSVTVTRKGGISTWITLMLPEGGQPYDPLGPEVPGRRWRNSKDPLTMTNLATEWPDMAEPAQRALQVFRKHSTGLRVTSLYSTNEGSSSDRPSTKLNICVSFRMKEQPAAAAPTEMPPIPE